MGWILGLFDDIFDTFFFKLCFRSFFVTIKTENLKNKLFIFLIMLLK